MTYDPARTVQRNRHAYRSPDHVEHWFWTVGCAPSGAKREGQLADPGKVGVGTVRRTVLHAAFEEFKAAFLKKAAVELTEEVGRAIRRAFRTPIRKDGPSPMEMAVVGWHSKMEWYVLEDDDGVPGDPIRDEPFTHPTSCLIEGLLQSKIFPGEVRPNIIASNAAEFVPELAHLSPSGKDRLLVPYNGNDPAKVAEWWGCFHFGFPRVKLVLMQEPRTKRLIPFDEDDLALVPAEVRAAWEARGG